MKTTHTKTAALWCINLFPTALFGQYHEPKLDGGGMFVALLGVGYEYCFNDEFGVQIRLGYFDSSSLSGSGDNLYTTFAATSDCRYYLDYDNGADGYFVGAYVKYRHLKADGHFAEVDPDSGEEQRYDYHRNAFGLGFTAGRHWVANSGFLFELYAGLGRYLVMNESIPEGFEESDITYIPYDLRFGMIVGWRFE